MTWYDQHGLEPISKLPMDVPDGGESKSLGTRKLKGRKRKLGTEGRNPSRVAYQVQSADTEGTSGKDPVLHVAGLHGQSTNLTMKTTQPVSGGMSVVCRQGAAKLDWRS